mmetsp:Transcript_13515/g.20107  ORF Transcript_13515/g.20107 Transcript_13515/m.20107 type:complete len:108 (-) Transcript_13515:356-679(-)
MRNPRTTENPPKDALLSDEIAANNKNTRPESWNPPEKDDKIVPCRSREKRPATGSMTRKAPDDIPIPNIDRSRTKKLLSPQNAIPRVPASAANKQTQAVVRVPHPLI